MRRSLTALAILAFALVLATNGSACTHKVTPASPAAAAAIQADNIVIRINELQATVIQACGPQVQCQAAGGIQTNVAIAIVQACIDARQPLRTLPDGWRTTIKTAWNQAKLRFTNITNPAIVASIALVDTLMGEL